MASGIRGVASGAWRLIRGPFSRPVGMVETGQDQGLDFTAIDFTARLSDMR
jgi:hypothetical protein